MKFHTARILMVFSLISTSSFAMIPPWWYNALVLQNTIGTSPCVKVDSPTSKQGTWIIPIHVCSEDVGKALLFVLKNTKGIQVLDSSERVIAPFSPTDISPSIDFVAQQLTIALKENPLFVRLHKFGMVALNRISLEVKPKIVQFQTDNIGDPYRHSTFLAQDLFSRALNDKYFGKIYLSATTSPLPH